MMGEAWYFEQGHMISWGEAREGDRATIDEKRSKVKREVGKWCKIEGLTRPYKRSC
jgi:hypothetical protein